MQYYARKYGIKQLGMQPTPSLASSEANGKQAIEMTILISSLQDSPFANESWTLQDTSADLVLHTPPKGTFKKLPYTVEVLFDNDESNAFPYINYRLIYIKDENDFWYKTEGQTDYNGLFYIDENGDKAYFKLFGEDAATYSSSGTWTVRYNNHILSPPTPSSRPPTGSSNIIVIDSDEEPSDTTNEGQYSITDQETRHTSSDQSSKEADRARRRSQESPEAPGISRGRRQRESQSPPVKRAKADSTGGDGRRGARGGGTGAGGGGGRRGRVPQSAPTAAEVGTRHFSVTERGLSQLERLQEEARDPLVIIVQGQANCLKCWRRRLLKYSNLYYDYTTVFKWINNRSTIPNSRILIAFKSSTQRKQFLTFVKIPRQCTYSLGSLDAL